MSSTLQTSSIDPRLSRVTERLAAIGHELDPIGEMARHHLASPGSLRHARLALDAAQALGIDADRAVGVATACQLLHEAVVVHEDLALGAAVRRGEPSLVARFGARPAATFGDYLFMLAIDEASRVDGADAAHVRLFTTTALQAIRGMERDGSEASDLDVEAELDAWVARARRRAGSVLALPLESILQLAGASDATRIAAHVALEWAGAAADLARDLDDVIVESACHSRLKAAIARGVPHAVVLHHRRRADIESRIELRAAEGRAQDASELASVARDIIASSATREALQTFEGLRERAERVAVGLPDALYALVEDVLDEISAPLEALESGRHAALQSLRLAPTAAVEPTRWLDAG